MVRKPMAVLVAGTIYAADPIMGPFANDRGILPLKAVTDRHACSPVSARRRFIIAVVGIVYDD